MTPCAEHRVLVKGNEFAENFRREPIGEDCVRWAIALEDAVRHEPVRHPLGLDLLGRLAECQRLGLGEDVRNEYVVVATERVERLSKCDEVARDEPCALVDQLIEGMLPVSSRLAPIDRAGRVGNLGSVQRDVLSVTLHRQLLQIGGESLQILFVRQDRNRLGAEEVAVPDAQQTHQDR